MSTAPFPDTARVDALEKVRGAARYGADNNLPGMLHAALATATICKGRIESIDTRAAHAVRGVRMVLTHEDLASEIKPAGFLMAGGYAVNGMQPMLSPQIAWRGQPVALVVAETLQAAIEAAALIRPNYVTEAIAVDLDAEGTQTVLQAESQLPKPMYEDIVAGDAEAAFAEAPLQVDAAFITAAQHQNPIELVGTVVEWKDGRLIVHEGTQNAEAMRHGLARQFGLTPDQVQIVAPYCGGGFGQKNSLQVYTPLVAAAARRTNRPVKLVAPRWAVFHNCSFRPASRHRFRLGADKSGKLVAAIHESDSQTSRHDLFPTRYAETTGHMYAIDNFRGRERLVRTDVQTPGYMRAPFEHIAAFALESCVDEIAYKLGQDPVMLRLANDTQTDPISKKPFSSRHLAECLERGARMFGWDKRQMAPGSMRERDGTLIGWGVAAGSYKAAMAPAVARLTVTDQDTATINVGVHEMGQGIRTALSNIVARKLGIAPERVTAEIGTTGASPQHLTAGSWGTATAVPAASEAADAMLRALAELGQGDPAGSKPAELLKAASRPSLTVEIRRKAPGQPEQIFGRLASGLPSVIGPTFPEFVGFSYIAHFVEVRIEPLTRRIRVPRVVSVVDCGRVVSPRTARSQVHGGVVWGIGAALREGSEVDPRFGGFLNADIAEYIVPVNADIGSIEVDFIDKPDPRLNDVGVKGLGEVVMVGVAPAIANAIFHATGKRLRDLPIRIEHVLEG
jgi:xanthine dehydrogenase YagR molybdenum-binding subunit